MTFEQFISRAARGTATRRWRGFALAAAAALTLLLFAACDRRTGEVATEIQEPNFVRGQQMLRSGQNQIALEAFLNVIEKRDRAPESHLEAGRIYLNHIKDPIAAIYHFRKYNELNPNSPQSAQVRQLIESATKEFARQLPGNPLEGHVDRLDLVDRVNRLTAENDRLNAEVQRLSRTSMNVPVAASQNAPSRGNTAPAGMSNPRPTDTEFSELQPVPLPGETVNQPQQPTRPAAANPSRPTNAGNAGARTYTVQAQDNLYRISVKMYGSGNRWRDILAANSDQLRSETDTLRVGMVLRIP